MNDPFLDPIKREKCVLLVDFCTYDPQKQHDPTCILDCGDHEFIKHPTFVDYKRAAIKRSEPLECDLRRGVHRPSTAISEDVYQRILQGFLISPDVERKIIRFIRHAGLTPDDGSDRC
jgi:hypothetical protein